MTDTTKTAEALANWLQRPVDWYVDGKPITMGECIRQQCGELALSYVQESFRVGAESALAASQPVKEAPADTLCLQLQRKCTAWGTYWRSSDAHGVDLSHEQALELLRDALGVEVTIATSPSHPERPQTARELPLAPECTPCAEHPGLSRCRGTAECWLCPMNDYAEQAVRELAAEAEANAEEGPLLVAARELIAGSQPSRECGGGYRVPANLWLALQAEAMEQLRNLARAALSARPEQAATPAGHPESLENFSEGQWWVRELDAWASTGTDDQKRAVAVVHRLLRAVLLSQKAVVNIMVADDYLRASLADKIEDGCLTCKHRALEVEDEPCASCRWSPEAEVNSHWEKPD